MFNISLYLEKYKEIKDPLETKRTVIATFRDVTGIVFKEEHIFLKNGVITLSTDSIQRSEIFQKKEELLEKFKTLSLVDIR